MKKSTKWLVALMAALAVAPNVAYLSQPTSELVSAVEQAQQQKLLSLGASLNPQQQEQTKNLLGAKDFSAANTLMVDGLGPVGAQRRDLGGVAAIQGGQGIESGRVGGHDRELRTGTEEPPILPYSSFAVDRKSVV